MYRKFIENILDVSGKISLKNFGVDEEIFFKSKERNQVVTKTDIEIGKYIRQKIEEFYPSYNIIDEESIIKNRDSEFTWVIDPLDGTSNFARKFPMYGIMLGLIKSGVPIIGAISLPYFSKVLYAESGEGVWIDKIRLKFSNKEILENIQIAYGVDTHPENPQKTKNETIILAELLLKVQSLRMINCSAFDITSLVEGKYGAVLHQTNSIWDETAPQVVVQEAGGIYTDFYGKKIDFSNPTSKINENFTCCAAAPKIHSQLQKIIHEMKNPCL